jgi:hypothetical protein
VGVRGNVRRHRVSIASGVALTVAVTGVVTYAASADGFRAHDARLNDGGIWVTNSTDGFYGRINKPIGQLDGALFAQLNATLDVVQDGAAVIGVNASDALISPIDPASLAHQEGEQAAVPGNADIALAGGTLAVADPADGRVWATRLTPGVTPSVLGLDQNTDPLAKVGDDATMTVTRSGRVLVVSAAEDTITTIAPESGGWAEPVERRLGSQLTESAEITAVGETPVVLDAGRVTVVGGGSADVPTDAVLQQAGPGSDTVLVASADALLEVGLSSGDVARRAEGVSGAPTTPVRLGDCVYGAWSGSPGYVATVCGDGEADVQPLTGPATSLVFRVNRGEIVLNDRTSGWVWDIDSDQPTRLDNWEDFRRREKQSDKDTDREVEAEGDRRPPQAKPDQFGARPGRLTVLHPLDNDTAPPGRILAIRSVDAPKGTPVTISPDGQTLQIALPESAGRTSFEYHVDDGRSGVSAHATVTVTPRAATANAAPHLREHFKDRVWTVPAGGVLDVPVLPDWRDKEDGDPLSVVSAAVGEGSPGASARVTSSGRVRFSAPAKGGLVDVDYAVSDGLAEAASHRLQFQVQGAEETQAVPAVAEPDIVSGQVGQLITIRPLGNDLPGSDPLIPDARLALGGKVVGTGGATVRTDLTDGTVTFTSDVPRSYFLDYDAAYGNAAHAPGRIRVDVRDRSSMAQSPVAVPDTALLRGQAAALVDVLANDADPSGGMLVVQRATPKNPDELDVAVVGGRWLRLAARQGQLSTRTQVVRYSLTNGLASTEGEVVVSWAPPPADNTPITEVDRVTVRAGGSAVVPVLDNDFSPAGDRLSLVTDLAAEEPGRLTVRGADATTSTGQAFVAGRVVRYVAPRGLTEEETFTLRYLATNDAGDTAPGRLELTVVPLSQRNRAPEPPVLEGRVVSGDTVKLRIPGVGVDPDGDNVTLLGLGEVTDGRSAPQLGRVTQFGANSLHYRAYPGSQGTEQFTYRVTDSFGGEATGSVRVAVVPPGPPQPPLAVDDVLTVEPGRRATVELLANDLIASGDRVRVTLVDPPAGAELESPTGPLLLDAPKQAGRNLEIVYSIDNGIDQSRGIVTLRTTEPYNNPPVVPDAFGRSRASDVIEADVLAAAYDPDGAAGDLVIAEVFAPEGVTASFDGARITATQGPRPYVLPFRVEDPDGGAATASLYVPAARSGVPHVVQDGLISLDPGESRKLDLSDYVVDPAGGAVRFTLTDRIWPSPAEGVSARITGEDRFTVTADDAYEGPGAVTVEVTTGTGADDPDATTAVVSVPVQVGEPHPVLRCPQEPVEIAQGEAVEIDVAALCHAWTLDPADVDALEFDASWKQARDGLEVAEDGGAVVTVAARGDVRAGTTGQLRVSAGAGDPGLVNVRVVSSPPPSLAPIRIADLKAGEERVVDLARYLRPGVSDPVPTVVSVEPLSTIDVRAVKEGASSVRITTADRVSGRAEFRVVVSDVSGDSGPERQVEGRISLDVLDAPATPKAPVPGLATRSHEVLLHWSAPAANGAPITGYELETNRGQVRQCASTSCDFGGLTNGTSYRFRVRARNAIGISDPSPWSTAAVPDELPGPPRGLTMLDRGDHQVTVTWQPPANKTSAIKYYVVSWPGRTTTTTGRRFTATGLDNNKVTAISVRARNGLGMGDPVTDGFQSIGTAPAPTSLSVDPTDPAGDSTAVRVSWPEVSSPNGPGPVRYTVTRDGQAIRGCVKITSLRCLDSGIAYNGRTYTYGVTAYNDDGRGAASAETKRSWSAVGTPAAWGAWSVKPTGRDNQAEATYTAPDSRGAQTIVKIHTAETTTTVPAHGPATFNVGVNTDGTLREVWLQVCNEHRCGEPSPRHQVRTYGGLRQEHIVSMDAHASPAGGGDEVLYWTITVDTNGNPARLVVQRNSGSSNNTTESFVLDAYGRTQVRTANKRIQSNTSDYLIVTLRDANPSRGPVVDTDRHHTADRIPPTVRISEGRSCGGTCGQIKFVTDRFAYPNDVSCLMYDVTAAGNVYRRTVDIVGNTTYQSPNITYSTAGQRIQAKCNGVWSNVYQWPS